MERSLKEIGMQLGRRIGLDPASLGPGGLAAAVQSRLTARRLASVEEYRNYLAAHEEEFQELAEEAVVPESWFFRDLTPFECLRWFVREACPARPIRVLSVPCGPGEEVYSLALALLGAGLMPDEFFVEGIDLSRRVLRRASDGTYGPRSFRETAAWIVPLSQRYLQPVEGGFRAGTELRAAVRFDQGNVADRGFLVGRQAAFEVIFCRNLIIYLDAEARGVVLANLHRLLAPNGLLYVGHTELRVTLDARFSPLNPLYPFSLTQAKPVTPPAPALSVLPVNPPHSPISSPARAATVLIETPPPDLLDQARTAANGGRLEEAARMCERLVQERPTSADVLSLFGVVRQASGDLAGADRLFQQALYLEPAHQDALVHLALLAERRGDVNSAAQFRRRAARAARPESTP